MSQKKTIFVTVLGGVAEVDTTTVPEGVEVEIVDIDELKESGTTTSRRCQLEHVPTSKPAGLSISSGSQLCYPPLRKAVRFLQPRFRGTCRNVAPLSSSVPDFMKHYAFSDAQFMSAREKALVLKAWVRFLKNGLRWEDFSDRLYKHLINHCGFIAHYSRSGFYATYFENGEDTTRFLSQFDKRGECRSVEYGGSWFDGLYEDLRRAMIEEASGYIPTLMEQASGKAKEADLAEARRLAAKHGFEIQQG